MKSGLLWISLFMTTCVIVPMDQPLIQQMKKTKRKNSDRLIFSKEYAMGNHMDCVAFLDDKHLMVGEPGKSVLMNVLSGEMIDFGIPANHIVSYPEKKLIVVTNSHGVGIYHVSLQDAQKISEKTIKKNTAKEVFSGRSFLMSGGKKLVTAKNNHLKIYSYKKDKIEKSLRLKPSIDVILYAGPNRLSQSLFFYQEKGYSTNSVRLAEVHKKKLLARSIVTNSHDISDRIRQLVIGPEEKAISFLMGQECFVFTGERLNEPRCMGSPYLANQFAMTFYTDSLLACLVLSDNQFMPDYRKLKVEFREISTQKIIFSQVIKSMPRQGFWYTENPGGLWGNPSEIIVSPDHSKYAVLWNNSVFVYAIPTKLWKKTPQFSTAIVNRIFMIYGLPLVSDVSLRIIDFLLLLYKVRFQKSSRLVAK